MSSFRPVTPLAALLALAPALLAHDADPKLRDKQPAYRGLGWRNAQLSVAPTGGPQALIAPPVSSGGPVGTSPFHAPEGTARPPSLPEGPASGRARGRAEEAPTGARARAELRRRSRARRPRGRGSDHGVKVTVTMFVRFAPR